MFWTDIVYFRRYPVLSKPDSTKPAKQTPADSLFLPLARRPLTARAHVCLSLPVKLCEDTSYLMWKEGADLQDLFLCEGSSKSKKGIHTGDKIEVTKQHHSGVGPLKAAKLLQISLYWRAVNQSLLLKRAMFLNFLIF